MQPDDVADALFTAIQKGDVDGVAALYADDIVIWHNFDGIEQAREPNLAVLTWLTRNVTDLRYEEIKRYAIDGGFLQQHVLRGTAPGGLLEVPCCLVVQVHHGKITRIEEYLDSAQLSPLST